MRERSIRHPRPVARWRQMNRREKGIAVALTAVMMTFVIPAAGLAVDASVLYGVKARLSASADAAALAAARSLSRGLTIAEQEDSAIDTAERFFHANFPDGYLYSSGKTIAAAVAETATRTRTVTVDVSVNAPSYFLRYLGRDMTTLRATGKASRRDVNVMMVLDRSGSLQTSGSCTPMKNAAKAFVNKFANYRDRVGMLSFAGDYKIDYSMPATPGDFLTGSGSIPTKISQITCSGYTNIAQGLWQAYEQLKAVNEPGALNAILFFTDGTPTAVTFDFSTQYYPSVPNALRTQARGYNGSYSSTSNISTYSKTPCSSTTGKRGFVYFSNTTVFGLYKPDNAGSLIDSKAGCVFAQSSGTTKIHGDFGFMPPQDAYGNNVNDPSYKGSLTLNTGGPDVNRFRINNAQNVERAGYHAANHAALRIRTNDTAASDLNTVIYSLGVGEVDEELLNRVSNTPESPTYYADQPEGLYVYAPTAAELSEAFARIAGEILRIAR